MARPAKQHLLGSSMMKESLQSDWKQIWRSVKRLCMKQKTS